MLYPLKFEPVYKPIIWGGRNLEKKFKRKLPKGNIAESWEVCCRSDGMSLVAEGPLKGMSLKEIMDKFPEELLGRDVHRECSSFPLLIKLIDANDKLSVQVHPDDQYALKNEGGSGKTEMWYVVDARPGARLIHGLKDNVSKSDFINAIEKGTVAECLREVPVKPGDSFYIPAGTVHAILDGILIAEVQQNSNTTYRVYDWGRVDHEGKGRQLHINKALDVIDFDMDSCRKPVAETKETDSFLLKVLVRSNYFTLEELCVKKNYEDNTQGMKFMIYIAVEGEGIIRHAGGSVSLTAGETVLVPACMGTYEVTGDIKALKAYV